MKSYFYIGVLLCATSGAIFEIVLSELFLPDYKFLQATAVIITLFPGLLISLFCEKGLEMNSLKILAIDIFAISAGIYIASLFINGGTPIFNFSN